jgi:hypothetical protein
MDILHAEFWEAVVGWDGSCAAISLRSSVLPRPNARVFLHDGKFIRGEQAPSIFNGALAFVPFTPAFGRGQRTDLGCLARCLLRVPTTDHDHAFEPDPKTGTKPEVLPDPAAAKSVMAQYFQTCNAQDFSACLNEEARKIPCLANAPALPLHCF